MQPNLKKPLSPARVGRISLVMGVLLLLTAFISLVFGTAEISVNHILRLLYGTLGADDPARLIILKIRLPRILLAGFVYC